MSIEVKGCMYPRSDLFVVKWPLCQAHEMYRYLVIDVLPSMHIYRIKGILAESIRGL